MLRAVGAAASSRNPSAPSAVYGPQTTNGRRSMYIPGAIILVLLIILLIYLLA
jgi:hypothetical protein